MICEISSKFNFWTKKKGASEQCVNLVYLQSDLEDAKVGLIVVEFPQISSVPLGKFASKMDRN